MKTSEILKKARALIADVGWCQGTWARGEDNRTDFPDFTFHGACAYCVEGALFKVLEQRDYKHPAYCALDDALWIEHGTTDIPDWNDDPFTTKNAVLKLYDAAITIAEKNETENAT